MKYREYAPAKPLDRYINCFWSLEPETGSAPPACDRSVPDGSLEFVLHLAEPMLRQTPDGGFVPEERAVLIGQTTLPYVIAPGGQTRLLGMRCFPHTGFLFVDGPVLPYNDQSVDLEAILPRGARLPFERVANAPTVLEAVRVLEQWCLDRLAARPVTTGDRRFAYACVRILRGLGMPSISSVSREAGTSTRHLERLFRCRAGISPKLFARIIRFQHALGHLDGGSGLAALAQRTGHFDQAHFTREFRRFAGVTPREFGREQHPWTRHFAEPGNRSYLYNSA